MLHPNNMATFLPLLILSFAQIEAQLLFPYHGYNMQQLATLASCDSSQNEDGSYSVNCFDSMLTQIPEALLPAPISDFNLARNDITSLNKFKHCLFNDDSAKLRIDSNKLTTIPGE